MSYKETLMNARENLNASCRVCRECNGIACAGEVPGMGGKETASAFTSNYEALKSIKVNMRTIHNIKEPNMKCNFFGKDMDIPVFAAPVSGTTLNMGGKYSEEEYITWVIEGCIKSGIYPMVGDTAVDSFLTTNLKMLNKYNGDGIVFIKPWENENVIKKIKLAEEAGAFAVGMDIDACGLITLALHGKPVMPKTVEDIREIAKSTKLPFILKGIMTVDEALLAVEAGVDGIVVSNHGGRVLDHTPGVAEVLPAIAEEVKGKVKIFADGGVRTGIDVLKLLALGADGILIGRPFVWASFGGKTEGVQEYINTLKSGLKSAMILTGCADVNEVDSRIIYK
ncbi:alpha-hydroxy-acid oxidizing protein [Oceanirhabdus sp. W0125-5]|uniref:alpha-hydroxy-acid oxidizing protein n=1 Tax=Oceanirhabdus sp. W0125-5 TaxID=2999116 RepID=UPI0022F30E78|nr:alpha-hydroxy-acid oxidizing protein [Oceanirhabdus sp. W0125-5]WBW99417.1 alpha-hydroxy-acid oxidizing protein [Oceanirhabdus sp. W0125-5]